MPHMPKGENRSSERGMKHESGHPKSVAGIEEHSHAGEQGANHGVVFKLPKESDITDHSKVRELD